MKRFAFRSLLAVAMVAVLGTAVWAARPRSARDEPLRHEGRPPEPPPHHGGPGPQVIVLRFEHIPAESFVETLHQLAERNEPLREGLKQMPVALNGPANAVVFVAPPEVAGVMMRVAGELDQPNAFEQHVRERDRDDVAFRMELEKHKPAIDLAARQPHVAGPPRPPHGPQPGRPPMKGPGGRRPALGLPPHGPPGPGSPPGADPERVFRQQIEQLEALQQRLQHELELQTERIQRQLEEIQQHKRQLHEVFERRMQQQHGEQERRMQEERERRMHQEHARRVHPERERAAPREREEMERREREQRERAAPREREEMERREREQRERAAPREREEMERREREQRERAAPREREEREHRGDPRGRPHPGEGRGPGPRGAMQGRPGAGLETLLSPRLREALGLSDEQIDRIRRLLAEVRQGMERTMDRIREAAKTMRPEARAKRMQEIAERLKAIRAERMRGVHERLMEILRPEQREKVEQMRRGGHPAEPPRPPERPDRPAPPRPRDRPDERHRPAVEQKPAEFRLIDDVVVAANGAVAVEIQASPGGARVLRSGAAGVRGGWSQMSEAERQAMREKFRARYLFRMLSDEDARAELDLSADQEKRIVALIEKSETQRTRIEDDVRMQFGSNDAAGPDPGDPSGREREMRRETWQAMREAQPAFDTIMQEALGVLTDEQKAKLEQVIRERMRLMAACGNLYLLTTASAAEQLDLADGQSTKIKKTLLEAADRADAHRRALDEKRRAVEAANPQAGGEERRQAYRAIYEGIRKFREESIRQARDRVFRLLTDDQRAKAEKLLAEADANRRGMFYGGGAHNIMRFGGQSRTTDPVPPDRPRAVPALYEGDARFVLAGKDFDGPKRKPRKDGFKSPKTKPSKSQGAFADRTRAVMILRLLQDPAIRTEVGLSGEQEQRISVLRERVQGIEDRIRDDVREILGDRMKNATAEQRRDIKRQAAEIAKEARRAAAGDMEAIVKEAAELLTPDQQAKLKVIERDRAQMYGAVGRLALLLEARIREKIGLSDDQAEHIRLILEDVRKQVKDQQGWPSGDLADAKRRHADRVRAARERVMRVLRADQRERLERLLGGSSKKVKKHGPPETAPATKGYGRAA